MPDVPPPTEADMMTDLEADLAWIDTDAPMMAAYRIRAAALAAIRRAVAAEAECLRLRGIIDGLAERVATQSEILSSRAETAEARVKDLEENLDEIKRNGWDHWDD